MRPRNQLRTILIAVTAFFLFFRGIPATAEEEPRENSFSGISLLNSPLRG